MAVEHGIKFLETSAKTGANVDEAFTTIAKDIKTKMEKKLVRFLFVVLRLFYLIRMRSVENYRSGRGNCRVLASFSYLSTL